MAMVTGVSRYTVKNRLRGLARLSCRVAACTGLVGDALFADQGPGREIELAALRADRCPGLHGGVPEPQQLAAARALGVTHTSQKAQLGGRRYFPCEPPPHTARVYAIPSVWLP